jgi:hypothetical protein
MSYADVTAKNAHQSAEEVRREKTLPAIPCYVDGRNLWHVQKSLGHNSH